ncbi:MAG: SDR family NAD(P)-dependent oxidoreductase [Deltaproteobacteria bacterium]|nr:SDR family NAD(P)-dependent oxidoreductase [Deltaproteobacteria bacterium]
MINHIVMWKMSKKIDQRVAIVTGGSGGLGKAVALRLAGEGTAVVVHYNRNEKKAEEIVERIRQSGGKAIAASADLTQFAQAESLVEQTVQQFGGLDILAVCSGGHDIPDEMRSLPRSERYRIWNRLVEFNMSGPMFCAYAAFPYMAKQGYGRIVFSASVAKNGLMVALDFLDEIHRCGYAAS